VKIVIFSATDGPLGAGAGALRLHRAFRAIGQESLLAVWEKTSLDENIVSIAGPEAWSKAWQMVQRGVGYAHNRKYRPKGFFDYDSLAAPWSKIRRCAQGADVIQLAWTNGLLNSSQIGRLSGETRSPVVWTLMDHAPLTGGCHYVGACRRFADRCGNCPVLGSQKPRDLSARILARKQTNFARARLALVLGSTQDESLTRQSALFSQTPSAIIPVPVDAEVFRPINPAAAREVLGLPMEAHLIFLGALNWDDERKGIRYLIEALQILARNLNDGKARCQLLVAGDKAPKELMALPFKIYQLGVLRDQRSLALAYQAADFFLSPSVDDSGPMMVLESLLCGTPIAAFPIGYAADLLPQNQIGGLAKKADSQSLAQIIQELLALPHDSFQAMRDRARRTAVDYCSMPVVANRYLDFYRRLRQPLVSSR
jgi:glycosyltransferase involved in cell wall biosynthesis